MKSKTYFSKVPELTLLFRVIKIAATTLGETAGDAVSMSMNLGYLVASSIFGALFLIAVVMQIRSSHFRPMVHWFTVISTTTVGTTLADYADRSLGICYAGGATLLFTLLILSLCVWKWSVGSVSASSIDSPKKEIFYWVTILFSQTLGTALGDWTADTQGLGYLGGIAIFVFLLAVVVILYWQTKISRVFLFWTAFILTRPLGAVVGDFLDKPVAEGGMALSRFTASAVLLAFIIGCLLVFEQRPSKSDTQAITQT